MQPLSGNVTVTGCCEHHLLETTFSPESSSGNKFILIASVLLSSNVSFCMEYVLYLPDTGVGELEFVCQH